MHIHRFLSPSSLPKRGSAQRSLWIPLIWKNLLALYIGICRFQSFFTYPQAVYNSFLEESGIFSLIHFKKRRHLCPSGKSYSGLFRFWGLFLRIWSFPEYFHPLPDIAMYQVFIDIAYGNCTINTRRYPLAARPSRGACCVLCGICPFAFHSFSFQIFAYLKRCNTLLHSVHIPTTTTSA